MARLISLVIAYSIVFNLVVVLRLSLSAHLHIATEFFRVGIGVSKVISLSEAERIHLLPGMVEEYPQ
ncbi:MAG: hypothetical protein KCHDKBKB_02138 [Elusimicrobia bacterium]|nr:hypothetical protein [Elusimicrobiota bacterium]